MKSARTADAMPGSGKERTARLAGRRILVLEDDYYLAMDTAQMLRGAGADIAGPFPTVEAAIGDLEAQRPACAVVDVNLGNGATFDLPARLDRLGVPFVFLTGYDAQAVPKPFADRIRFQKPADLARLVDTIADLIKTTPSPGRPD